MTGRTVTLARSSMQTVQPQQSSGDHHAPSLWLEQPDLHVQPNVNSDGRDSRRLVGTWSTGRQVRRRADVEHHCEQLTGSSSRKNGMLNNSQSGSSCFIVHYCPASETKDKSPSSYSKIRKYSKVYNRTNFWRFSIAFYSPYNYFRDNSAVLQRSIYFP